MQPGQVLAAMAMLRTFYDANHLSDLAAALATGSAATAASQHQVRPPAAGSLDHGPIQAESGQMLGDLDSEEEEVEVPFDPHFPLPMTPPQQQGSASALRRRRDQDGRLMRRRSMHGGWGEDGEGDLWRMQQQLQQRHGVTLEDIQEAESDLSGRGEASATDAKTPGLSPGGIEESLFVSYPHQEPAIDSLAQLLHVIRLADQFQADHVMKVEETSSFPLAPYNPSGCNSAYILSPM